MRGKKTKSSARIRLILLAGSVVLLAAVPVRIAVPLIHDAERRSAFAYERSSQYRESVPMERMDMRLAGQYIQLGSDLIHYGFDPNLTLPFTLDYFASNEAGAQPVYTLPAGTKVRYSRVAGSPLDLGYGICGFPTYDRGWRYALPFLKENQTTADEPLYYFVRTADLERIAERFFALDSDLFKSRPLMTTRAAYAHWAVRSIDEDFYRTGTFLSPDLGDRILDEGDLALAVAGLVLLGGWAVLRFRRSRWDS